MTVTTEGCRYTYSGNGVTVAFSYPRKFIAEEDLKVYLVNTTSGAATLQTLNTDYTTTGEGLTAGGTVTFVTAPASGYTVVIYGDLDLTQGIDLDSVTAFEPVTIEGGFDRSMVAINQINDRIGRGIRLSDYDPATSFGTLPVKSSRASRVLGFDADGLISMYTTSSLTALATASTDGAMSKEDKSFLDNLRVVNPMTTGYDATGDGVADDTEAVQAALDYIASGLSGGVLLLTHKHRISSTLTYTDGSSLAIMSPHFEFGQIIYDGATDSPALYLHFDVFRDDRVPTISRVTFTRDHDTEEASGTAIKIEYDDLQSGSKKGFIIEHCRINEDGAGWWKDGISLNKAPRGFITGCRIAGRNGLNNDKSGAGIRCGTWCQAVRINDCDIYGFDRGIYVDPSASLVASEDFQAEGYRIHSNTIQSCEVSIDFNLDNSETAHHIFGNAINGGVNGIRARNVLNLHIFQNIFQWTRRGSAYRSDILLLRDDGDVDVPVAKSLYTHISGNKTLSQGNMKLTIAGMTLGAGGTTVDYIATSTPLVITGISSTNPAVVTYLGSDSIEEGDDIVIAGITTGPTELNDIPLTAGIVDTGANTIELVGIDGTLFSAAWSAGGTVGVLENEDPADGDQVHLYDLEGTVEANNKFYTIDNVDTVGKTFDLLDYQTGDPVDSSGWTAWSSGGFAARRATFVEVKGGNTVVVTNNITENRQTGYYLWPETTNIRWNQNYVLNTGRNNTAIEGITTSSYPTTNRIIGAGATTLLSDVDFENATVTNLVRNGNFELGSKFWELDTGYALEEDAAEAQTGYNCIVYTRANGSSVLEPSDGEMFAVSPGDVVYGCAFVRNDAGTGAYTTNRLSINWFDKDRNSLGNTSGGNVWAPSTSWTRLNVRGDVTADAPSGTAYARIKHTCNRGGSANVHRIDNIKAIVRSFPISTGITTFAALPSTPRAGDRNAISDCNTTLAAGIGTNAAAGGANKVPVWYDGSNWIIG